MSVRVAHIPFLPQAFVFGGFEMQMLNAIKASCLAGVRAFGLDVWEREAGKRIDIVHFWGLEVAHRESAAWAKRNGFKVVLTALLPYMSIHGYLTAGKALLTGSLLAKRTLLVNVDALAVVNQGQRRYAEIILGYPRDKIYIIPNIVEDGYFLPRPKVNVAWSDYVLCVGNICRRKNQLTLAEAAQMAGRPIVFVGGKIAGEEKYFDALESMAGRNQGIHLAGELASGSPELVALFRGASVYALLSHNECQPISALEAIASNVPLLLSDKAFARQSVFVGALLTDPTNGAKVARAISRIYENPLGFTVAKATADEFRISSVGRRLSEMYEAVCREKRI